MPQTGVIILAHGSRGERGVVEVSETLRRVSEGVKPMLRPGVKVIGAALQFNHPSLEEAVESLAGWGVNRMVIMPYFLFPGRHITEDIPQLIERLKCTYPETQFIITDILGLNEHFIDRVAKCIEKAAPELSAKARGSSSSAEAIEYQSLEIIEGLLPSLDCSEEERQVIKRIVHAAGDSQIARLVRFHTNAVSAGIDTIRQGKPIFTDVRMVAVGINPHLTQEFGCSIHCALDELNTMGQAQEEGVTRNAAAIRFLGRKLDGAIVTIGNAPTALLALLELIDSGDVLPSLVVGMPVGFVQARESKADLIKRNIPYITIEGTRGGSAVATATVNALLNLAREIHK